MKISANIQSADAKEVRRQGELGFTMIEIAIAIGVIGFALVAIIGILPTGMNTQKDNREDTVISQDAPYFLEAIRNGAPVTNGVLAPAAGGLDFLTNYVQSIRFDHLLNGATNSTFIYNAGSNLSSGAEIIGLLSAPQTNYASPFFSSNYFDVTATVRALSGPATEQPNGSGLSSVVAFTYNMEVMITPYDPFPPNMDSTNWVYYANLPVVDTNQVIIRSNRWLEAAPGFIYSNPPPLQPYYLSPSSGALTFNLFDVRLRFSWPVSQFGNTTTVGPHRQTYRTLVAGQMVPSLLTNGVYGWYFQPQSFANSYPAGL